MREEEMVWENIEGIIESFNEYGFEDASLSRCGDGFILITRYTLDNGMGRITVPFYFDGTANDLYQAAGIVIGDIESEMSCLLDNLKDATRAANVAIT